MNYYKYPQRLLKKLNSESGVTLTILVITIVVLLIIASIVLVNSNAGSEQRALNNMYNDIRALDGKIAVYYEKNKELPVLYDESGKAKVALYFEKYDEFVPPELVRKGFAYGILATDEMKARIRGWEL